MASAQLEVLEDADGKITATMPERVRGGDKSNTTL